jgi:Family of unknown function (DUF6228)
LFSIHSVNSDRELRFQYLKEEYLEVELKGSGLSAVAGVSIYTYANGLNTFFEELSKFRAPWQGSHTWESLEGDSSISATCTTLGQVTLMVKLHHFLVDPEDWRVEAGLAIELGQLEKIAKDAKAFFQENGG